MTPAERLAGERERLQVKLRDLRAILDGLESAIAADVPTPDGRQALVMGAYGVAETAAALDVLRRVVEPPRWSFAFPRTSSTRSTPSTRRAAHAWTPASLPRRANRSTGVTQTCSQCGAVRTWSRAVLRWLYTRPGGPENVKHVPECRSTVLGVDVVSEKAPR
jgi:hypothetical protein